MKELLKPLKIGRVELSNNLFLAPMAGWTDPSLRFAAKYFGAGSVCTEMVSSISLCRGNKIALAMLSHLPEEKPCAFQLFGNDPSILKEAAMIGEEKGFDYVDLNFGCPSADIIFCGYGAALLKEPKKIAGIVKTVVDTVKIPVTAKIRLGWDRYSLNYLPVSMTIQDSGASAIFVHARTATQTFSQPALWEYIRYIKERISIPVIGNGDVNTPADFYRLINETGCDGVMIGRAAKRRPWIFRDILQGKNTLSELSSDKSLLKEILSLLEKQAEILERLFSLHYALVQIKKHISSYLRGLYSSAEIRGSLTIIKNFSQLKSFLKELIPFLLK